MSEENAGGKCECEIWRNIVLEHIKTTWAPESGGTGEKHLAPLYEKGIKKTQNKPIETTILRQGMGINIPVGEINFPLSFLSRDLMIVVYLRINSCIDWFPLKKKISHRSKMD